MTANLYRRVQPIVALFLGIGERKLATQEPVSKPTSGNPSCFHIKFLLEFLLVMD